MLTSPEPLPASAVEGPPGEAERGALVLAGGKTFVLPFGTFHAPDISPSPQGVGGWSDAEITGAVMR